MANGHYVPGTDRSEMSRYRGKAIWGEILQITDDICDAYFARVHKLFNDAVTPDFSNKMKAGCPWLMDVVLSKVMPHIILNLLLTAPATCQKMQQLPMATHEGLVDIICVWHWLYPKIQGLVSVEYMDKLEDMFEAGSLV